MSIVSQTRHIVLVEDNAFQRLALIDILTLCGYKVSAFDNGALALDGMTRMAEEAEARGDEDFIDLVLCDIVMPEMDGIELLTHLKEDHRLADVPVVMMSANEEVSIISMCIDRGAKDYLVKPIQLQVLKGVYKYFGKKNKAKPAGNEVYERLETIGRGASGSVHLVRRVRDNEILALKEIKTEYMSDAERKLAENEVVLLKLLSGPTVVRYYDSWISDDTISIVMEYAEGGNLYHKIRDTRERGQKFPHEQITDWIAQIVLGIMSLHSKSILHRDLKSQNLFLTKENSIKLGDFGIAKALSNTSAMAQTSVGTPYFMSPELCRGESYGRESDMWAFGCIVYEMVTLKRPFEHSSMQALFVEICESDPDPLPEDTPEVITRICYWLLQKDPRKRPSCWELAQDPIIHARINYFVHEWKCADAVRPFFDPSNSASEKSLPDKTPAAAPAAASRGEGALSVSGSGDQANGLMVVDNGKGGEVAGPFEMDTTPNEAAQPDERTPFSQQYHSESRRSFADVVGVPVVGLPPSPDTHLTSNNAPHTNKPRNSVSGATAAAAAAPLASQRSDDHHPFSLSEGLRARHKNQQQQQQRATVGPTDTTDLSSHPLSPSQSQQRPTHPQHQRKDSEDDSNLSMSRGLAASSRSNRAGPAALTSNLALPLASSERLMASHRSGSGGAESIASPPLSAGSPDLARSKASDTGSRSRTGSGARSALALSATAPFANGELPSSLLDNYDTLSSIAFVARGVLPTEVQRSGVFGVSQRVFSAPNLVDFLCEHFDVVRERAGGIAQDMVDVGLLVVVGSSGAGFEDDPSKKLRFYYDTPGLPLNMTLGEFKGTIADPLMISCQLVDQLRCVLESPAFHDDHRPRDDTTTSSGSGSRTTRLSSLLSDDGSRPPTGLPGVDIAAVRISEEYRQFVSNLRAVQGIDASKLNRTERKAFFLNIALLLQKHEMIECGDGSMRDDSARSWLDPAGWFTSEGSRVDEQLNVLTRQYLNERVRFTLHSAHVPLFFKHYANDFGQDKKQVLRWILDRMDVDCESRDYLIQRQASAGLTWFYS
ncbi:unnamed protein product [Vitrella brassicaformis CCMP3155]|uniref:non-specific serine/threonine protein kinase n=2 Tax=Vitrella brassicaformis TaxID=1169539 RepID=A0A0G4EGE5_VITBC|nr:unnamed protein product [Vitrella brassicaformis CCMP3155]|eukprot:CEL94548.1 unnamed protein product [Vitrella brassicaformis CCMP3155]